MQYNAKINSIVIEIKKNTHNQEETLQLNLHGCPLSANDGKTMLINVTIHALHKSLVSIGSSFK